MKKSVVILIALIYVASIALVGFLGLKAKTYNDIFYVESIEILNDYSVDRQTGNKYMSFNPKSDTDRSIKIDCRVLPDNSSDKKIIYALANDCTTATIDENGILTFNENISKVISVTVYLYSNQNTTISDKIVVYYVP